MGTMKIELKYSPLEAMESELLVVVVAVDSQNGQDSDSGPKPKLLTANAKIIAAASSVLGSGEFKAGSNEVLMLHAPAGIAARRLLLVGLGKEARATVNQLRQAAGTAIRQAKPKGIREVTIALPEAAELPLDRCVRVVAEGALVGNFDADTYKSDRKNKAITSLTILAPAAADKAALEEGLREGTTLGESQNFTRELVNEPGNKLTPTILAERAAAMAAEMGLACEVHSTEKIKELGMGAFWGVAQGSEEPPKLIVLRYEPAGVSEGPVLGLVGKGITFDSGGISLKPGENMEKMKYDMAGGAAMLGAMRAIASLKPKVRVLCVVCATENMPDGKAQKPGDVQTAMNGKTIEIINTDAEGRLILADGLCYAKQLGATHLIDAATLTGACMVALGMAQAGGFSNDDESWAKFDSALLESGEKFWRMPLGDEYAEMIKSEIADVKNTGGRWGGASTAAEFLHLFAGDTPWIHLDIAGMAWIDNAPAYIAKGPSGIAVRSIYEYVRSFAQ